MTGFDTVIVVDWSAASTLAPLTPAANAIWIGMTRGGEPVEPVYCRGRAEAERVLSDLFRAEADDGRRVLAGFDFPFGYPAGFSRKVAGTDDPLRMWSWLGARVKDNARNANNRFDVAEKINRQFRAPGPFWGRPHQWTHRYPDLPATRIGAGVVFEPMDEFRACEAFVRETSGLVTSSCFQLFGNPTVGGQMLTGLPVLDRLRRRHRARVWPFEEVAGAGLVFAEIWPSLVNEAVAAAGDAIRDRAQVRLLSLALARLPAARLESLMEVPGAARQEGWILGAGAEADLAAALAGSAPAPLTPPRLDNDCFALPAGVDWTPVDEALSRLRQSLRPVVGTETAPLGSAAGRVLAAPVAARRANPPAANTAVDGYGFSHGAIGTGDVVLPLVPGRAAAGAPFEGVVPAGHAVRILTGALLPEGVDTVVLDEDTDTDGARVAFTAGLKAGANTRRAGEDVAEGDRVLPAGHRLRPPDLALLAATGHADVELYHRLRIAVLSTGDELAGPGETADPGRTYDANRPMLMALARAWGAETVDLGRAPDSREAVRAALERGAAEADLVLTSGGASAGDEDHVSAVLRDEGSLTSWRIALKPGRPLALAMWRGTPVMGLPGNPVAALVCALIFARPAVGVLGGEGWREPLALTVPAAFEKRKKPGRREFLRARLTPQGHAEVFRSEGSGRISGLVWAEGFVELPDGEAHIRPGDPVRYLPYAGFGL